MAPNRCVAIILAAFLILSSCAQWTPQGTVKAFYAAIAECHPDEAIDLLSSQVLKDTDREKLRAGFIEKTKQVMARGGMKNLEIANEAVAGEIATMTVRVTYGNGSAENEPVELIKEKGFWRIQPGDQK